MLPTAAFSAVVEVDIDDDRDAVRVV